VSHPERLGEPPFLPIVTDSIITELERKHAELPGSAIDAAARFARGQYFLHGHCERLLADIVPAQSHAAHPMHELSLLYEALQTALRRNVHSPTRRLPLVCREVLSTLTYEADDGEAPDYLQDHQTALAAHLQTYIQQADFPSSAGRMVAEAVAHAYDALENQIWNNQLETHYTMPPS
jgi:hypothetical protein